MAWTLCTKEDVLSIHSTNERVLQDFWSDAVEDMIRKHLGQPYLGMQQTITDERHSGDGTNILRVSAPPIVSITDLKIDGYSVSSSDYVASEHVIQLLHVTFPDTVMTVSVSYISGSQRDELDAIALSPIVRMTAAAMLVAIVNYKGRVGSDASIRWGSPDKSEGESSPNVNIGLTSHLVTIMNRMLKRSTVRFK